MQTVAEQDYHAEIETSKTASEVFDALCHVEEWWARTFEGRAQEKGDKFSVTFGTTYVNFEVTESIPDKKMVWLVNESSLPWLKDDQEWTNTTIVWHIMEKEGRIILEMTHKGLLPQVECYGNCEQGWNFYVKTSLKNLIETGTGSPDTPRDKR